MKRIIIFALCILAAHSAQCQSKKRAARYADDKHVCDSLYQTMSPLFTIENDGELIFTRVITDANNRTSDALFTRCLEILNTSFNDAAEVIQTTDKAAGLILGKFNYYKQLRDNIVGAYGNVTAATTFKIETKDGRLRVSASFVSLNIYINRNGTSTYHVGNYYPFWTDCPPKRIKDSFFSIYPIMQHCVGFLDYIQQHINDAPATDEW